ncbi:unnamed protein product [Pseudo-nitzschia multistriata]|uniref:Uncharacterized protein n=1 Tax=Pseudo-nitzschia multistriata TaxID=183589 RepID=A0A448ZAP3_9STRA|nr:unnamed protein product [Pseudo-nitzschia multistriata]
MRRGTQATRQIAFPRVSSSARSQGGNAKNPEGYSNTPIRTATMESAVTECGTKRTRTRGSLPDGEIGPGSGTLCVAPVVEAACFLEFRRSTLHRFPALSWLGPSVMAVYWFKEYLNKPAFGWVRCPAGPSPSPLPTKDRRPAHRRRQRAPPGRRSGGRFWFVPGQYLRSGKGIAVATPDRERAVRGVLEVGTPGVHFATSYTGVYNLLRRYGRFGVADPGGTEGDRGGKRARSDRGPPQGGGPPGIVPCGYAGPPLPGGDRGRRPSSAVRN